MRIIALSITALLLAACGSMANTRSASAKFEAPPQNSTVLVMKPDVSLAVLTASGMTEPRADWNASATENLALEAEEFAKTRHLNPKSIDPDAMGDAGGRAAQVLKLHRAVGQSISLHSYGMMPLPTKSTFDWTLGDGAAQLGGEQDAAYALFITAGGTYADGGRVAASIAMAMVGVSLPLGGQQVFASLVELKTGRVMWSNMVIAGNHDMRSPDGADALAKTLFQDAPL